MKHDLHNEGLEESEGERVRHMLNLFLLALHKGGSDCLAAVLLECSGIRGDRAARILRCTRQSVNRHVSKVRGLLKQESLKEGSTLFNE